MSGRKTKKSIRNRSRAEESSRRGFPAGIALLCAAALAGLALVWASSLASESNVGAGLRISEVMTSNGSALVLEDGSMPDWIELENTSDQPVELAGWALLTQDQPANAFTFPGGTLQAGERVVIYCDDSDKALVNGAYHAPFRLSAAGETIALLDRHGRGADLVTTPALARDQVYCRDDAGAWSVSDYPSPGGPNRSGRNESGGAGQAVVPGALEITEVMSRNASFFPDENGEHPDYVEIRNISDAPVALEGWTLSDAALDPKKWCFPALTLPAGGIIAVHCSGVERLDDPEHLHAGFRLDRDGEVVTLTDPDGTAVSRVEVPALSADQAYVKLESGWTTAQAPSPGLTNDQAGADAAADAILAENRYGVFITELLASSNKSGDWIELYNSSGQAVDLSGFGLSDNAARPRKWQFPAGTMIAPGEYLGVYADNNEGAADGKLHANFALSAGGGYSVTLSDPGGAILDRLYVLKQEQNISFGRPESLTCARYFETPSPGAANTGASYIGRAPQPTYSTPGGLYRIGDALTVALNAPSDCQIHYTLDCSDPTEASALYTEPIPITGTTILRARVYREGCMPSYMDAQSYLFDVNNGGGTIYVVSLVSDPYNLTSDEYGIMAMGRNAPAEYPHGNLGRGANFWMDWEREAHVEVFAPDGSTMLSQECGTKLHGESGRARKQKAFKVIARNRYGSNRFQASLFTRRPYEEYQSFVLRAASQDAARTRMRDPMLQQIAAATSVMYQEYEIGELYLNGKFWGHYNLRENLTPVSICQFEGWEGDEDDIDFIKHNSKVMQGSNETMAALLEWIRAHDGELNTDAAYDMIDANIDIQNYLEYMAMEIYVGNTDVANIKRYRNGKRDGKWRWILYDLDMAFYEDTNSVRRWMTPGGTGSGNAIDNTLFIACIKNSRTRAQFLGILGNLMDTVCSTENILDMAEQFYNKMLPILPDQFERWEQNAKDYESELKKLVRYAKTRPMRMLQFLKGCKYLSLTRDEMERYFSGTMSRLGVGYDEIEAA